MMVLASINGMLVSRINFWYHLWFMAKIVMPSDTMDETELSSALYRKLFVHCITACSLLVVTYKHNNLSQTEQHLSKFGNVVILVIYTGEIDDI